MIRSLLLSALLISTGGGCSGDEDGAGTGQGQGSQTGAGASGSGSSGQSSDGEGDEGPAAGSDGPAAGSAASSGSGDSGSGAGPGDEPRDDPGTGPGDDPGVDPGDDGSDPNAVNPYPGHNSTIYAQDSMWMCKPGLSRNYCIEDIADATEALPDGTFRPFMDDLRTDHPIDCIFWYPTVNRTEDPTSHDFSDPEPMLSSIRSQAARFSRVCNVYAPFYRQRSLNNGGDAELGYMDVVDSFKHYIANWSEGRNFVVYGHSQGTGHAMRLINQEINGNDDLRGRLVSALMIGGRLTANSFSNIPLCTAPDQTGCAIGFQAYGVPQSLASISADLACTNPGALQGGKVLMKGAFFRARGGSYSPDLGTEFTANWGLFRDFFTAECVTAPSGGQVLQIDYANAEGDMRDQFLSLSTVIGFGLHVFDYQFPLDDLVELVRRQRTEKLAARR